MALPVSRLGLGARDWFALLPRGFCTAAAAAQGYRRQLTAFIFIAFQYYLNSC